MKNILENAGIKTLKHLSGAHEVQNILLISGHNDDELIRYLHVLGKKGLLRNKVILLNTCYANSNADLFHKLIMLYGPRAILHHGTAISPLAVQTVLHEIGEILKTIKENKQQIDPANLLREAAQRALDSSNNSNPLKEEIRKYMGGVLQISYMKPFTNSIGVIAHG